MIEVRDLRKSYTTGDFVQTALAGVSLTFRDNEFVAILGPSGSGKTTLLNILGGLDHADSGEIVIGGVSTRDYHDADWDTYRNHQIGFIFQSYNLIPHQSVVANVELALTLSGVGKAERRERALQALERVGLSEHAHKRPNQLSGGQMQRVAIARALVNDPSIVLADEPTGALDTETGVAVMELLKEIAQDRLVIMVTHNPELAEEYATRFVRLRDGAGVDDSNPLQEQELLAAPLVRRTKRKPERRASMSFLTALSLSFNNLMTKKGRTIMTAFASSIGIIGIAAILALANGVNLYIERTERDAMSGYPLQITRSSADISGLLEMAGGPSENARNTNPSLDDVIPESKAMENMFSTISNNDLKSFKSFLDSGTSGVEQYVSSIKYGYDLTPRFFRSDTSDGAVEVGNTALLGTNEDTAASAMGGNFGFSTGGSGVFQEMLDDPQLLSEQFKVVAGRWPEKYDEAVLVLSNDGTLMDFTLFGLGIADPREFTKVMQEFTSTMPEDVSSIKLKFGEHEPITYGEALDLKYKVVLPSDLYRRSSDGKTWTSISDDPSALAKAVDSSLTLKVVGVLLPQEGSGTRSLSQGLAYRSDLTTYLMDKAAASEIVKEQLADPKREVFTGKTFEELKSEQGKQFDLSQIFSVDENALAQAFQVNDSALQQLQSLDSSLGAVDMGSLLGSIDMGSLLSGVDLSGLQPDPQAIQDALAQADLSGMLASVPAPDFARLAEALGKESLSQEQVAQAAVIVRQIADGFMPFVLSRHAGEEIGPQTNLIPDVVAYLQLPATQSLMAQLGDVLGSSLEAVQPVMQDYLQSQVAPYFAQELGTVFAGLASNITELSNQAMQSAMQQIASQMGDALTGALGAGLANQLGSMPTLDALSGSMEDLLSIDSGAFANAIHVNLNQEDLTTLLANYAKADTLSYETNLKKLGYADPANPSSVSLYPVGFEAKERIADIITAYNDDQVAQGHDERVIRYTDTIGLLLSSVTDIVDKLSMVLISFVSISLVVSSIMIAIITYISVLERKKEIGILRAMGASKLNVANVFNAETVIEGFIAGVMAVVLVALASIPVNAMVLKIYDVPDIMQLPLTSALALVAISVALTFVAGLIPSSAASRHDPVEALRSE